MKTQQSIISGESPALRELFQILRDGAPHTRASLAELTGLARSTVAARIDALMELGFVEPIGRAASTGGRPSSQFALNAKSRIALAVDLGAAHCRIAVTDLQAGIIASRRMEVSVAEGPETILSLVEGEGINLLRELGRSIEDLIGVGVGLPGPVEHTTGRPSTPPIMPGWDGYDVPGRLKTFGVPILVDNDVNIMSLGERAAAWSEVENLVFIKVATGIGAGIIASGVLQRGAQGIAGDLGRMRVPDSGTGTVKTLEEVASGSAVAANLRAQGLDVPDSRALATLLRAGSAPAVQAMRQAGRHLGEALTNVVCMLNPSVIVLGGGLSAASEDLLAGVREVVYSQSMPLASARLDISRSVSGEDAAIIGAGLLVVDSALAGEVAA